MKKLILIVTFLLWQNAFAGSILSKYVRPRISQPDIQISDSVEKALFNIYTYDLTTAVEEKIGTIDLFKYGMTYIWDIDIFAVDYVRDRILISAQRQMPYLDYKMIDLRTMTLDSTGLDSLINTKGRIHITPGCNYIIAFGYDVPKDTLETHWTNPNLVFTCTFDAETYKPIATIRGLSAFEGATTPDYFLPDGDSLLYISDPLKPWGAKDLIKLSLPDLKILDTIAFVSFCIDGDFDFACDDVRDSIALIDIIGDKAVRKFTDFKVINIVNKTLISSLSVPDSIYYHIARLSTNGKWVGLGRDNSIDIYDLNFNLQMQIENCDNRAMAGAFFDNDILIASCDCERFVTVSKYDILTGRKTETLTISHPEE